MSIKINDIKFTNTEYAQVQNAEKTKKYTPILTTSENNRNYTTIERHSKYAENITELVNKFNGINPEEYLEEAKHNGYKTLTITQEDYEKFGKLWDN